MRKRELERYRKKLLQARQELLEQTTRMRGEGRQTLPEGGEDYVDDAVTHYTREFLLSLSQLELKRLVLVEEALRRIRDGEYGLCLNCGEKIGTKRLDAIPWARYCVTCQEMAEREEFADTYHIRDLAEEVITDEEEVVEAAEEGEEEEAAVPAAPLGDRDEEIDEDLESEEVEELEEED